MNVMQRTLVIACVVSLALAFGARTSRAAEWQVLRTGPSTFNSIWGAASNNVFAVGDLGTIHHFDGTAWSAMSSGTTQPFNGVWGSSSSDVFAVGNRGTILHYDGSAWVAMSSGTTFQLSGVWGTSASDVFAVGYLGTILHYDGAAWTAMPAGTTSQLFAIWGTSASDVFAAGQDGTMLHYDGAAWTAMSSGTFSDFTAIWGTSASDVFAAAYSGDVFHYNGSTWLLSKEGMSPIFGFWGTSPSDVYGVGWNSVLWHYDGAAWSYVSTPSDGLQLRGIWGTSASDIFVAGGASREFYGQGGRIVHYDGSAWDTVVDHPPLRGVWGAASSDVFAVGDGGTILHYDGAAWTAMPSGTTAALYGVWGAASNDVFAVGLAGTILHYDGTTWSAMPSGTTSTFKGVWGTASNDVFAVTSGGMILHYNGSAWTTVHSASAAQKFTAIWGSSASDVFAVGYPYSGHLDTVRHYDGSTWTVMSLPTKDQLHSVGGTASGDVFVGGWGLIKHYDGGAWTTMPSGTTAKITGFWCASSSDVFATGAAGTILRYNGSAWATMSSGVFPGLNGTWGAPSGKVFAVGDSGTVLMYQYREAVTVTIAASAATAAEAGMTPGMYTVTRTGSTAAALAVDFAVSGTATPGSDYANVGTSVTIPAGATSATVAVTPVDDMVAEADETVVVTLSVRAAYEVGSPASATVTIVSDDVNVAPTIGTLTPSDLVSAPDLAQTFSAVYSDANGWEDLKYVSLLVNPAAVGANGIWLLYDRTTETLYLYDDAGSGHAGSCTPGGAGTLSNTQGGLDCAATTVNASGDDLTVIWSIIPSAAFASVSRRNIYLSARDMADASVGWADKGDWAIFESPTDISLVPDRVAENQASGTLVGTVSATDPDGGAVTCSLVSGSGGEGNSFFTLTDGVLRTAASLDHETQGTLGILVRCQDTRGSSATELFVVTVTNLNEPPALDPLASPPAAEGTTLEFSVTAADPDEGDTLTYTIAGPKPGGGAGDIDPATGLFTWATREGDAGSHHVMFTVTDADGASDSASTELVVTPTNQSPYFDPPPADQVVVEGGLLSFTVVGRDEDGGDVVTLSMVSGPPGAAFDAAVGSFAWTPGFHDAGTHQATFRVTDDGTPALWTEAAITIIVEDPAGAIFEDSFDDGTAGGDPDWTVEQGAWSVASERYVSGRRTKGISRVSLFDPVTQPLGAGVVDVAIKLTSRSKRFANGSVFFGYSDAAHYRFVQVRRGRVRIGQVGDINGTTAGIKGAKRIRMPIGRFRTFRVGIYPDGLVRVYQGTKLVLLHQFPAAAAGGVGLGADRAKTLFDNVKVWDDSALAP